MKIYTICRVKAGISVDGKRVAVLTPFSLVSFLLNKQKTHDTIKQIN